MIRDKGIQVVTGDILLATENILVHQVNCMGKMGSGLALHLRKKYPMLYDGYVSYCRLVDSPSELLGDVYFYYHSQHRIVANVFGQLYYGRKMGVQYTDYDALASGMIKVGELARRRNLTVAIPFGMGAGLGGGDWNIIRGIMESNQTTVNRYTRYYKLG